MSFARPFELGLLGLFSVSLAACLDVGLDEVTIPVSLAGTAPGGPIDVRGGFRVELRRADLAFGPLRLCAGERANGLCDTARAEWLDSAVVDALSDEAALAGELHGSAGVVRSAMYDLGIVSLLAQRDPLVLSAAEALGQSSLALEGTATRADSSFNFSAQLRIEQAEDVERGTPVVRLASSPDQVHDLGAPGSALTLRFDASSWLADVDFEALLASPVCQPTCTDPLVFTAGSQAERAIYIELVAGARPTFEWSAGAL